MTNDHATLNTCEDAIFALTQKARGVHAAALYVAADGLVPNMAEGLASLVGSLCDDLEKLLNQIERN